MKTHVVLFIAWGVVVAMWLLNTVREHHRRNPTK